YEIRNGGQLWWRTNYPSGSNSVVVTGDWKRVGRRSDWVGLQTVGAAAFGLTADGMLWTWGQDFGIEPDYTLKAKIEMLSNRIFGGPPPSGIQEPYKQEKPRPLMRLETKAVK